MHVRRMSTMKISCATYLFPYHLAENVCRVQRVSPFRYYIEMLYEVMKNEKPYDSIPNFTAADALRLTGIGRNEFIDIMNKCRAKLMWKLNKSIVKDMLPVQPVHFPLEPWWAVGVVNLTVEEYRKLTEDEMVVISEKGNKGEVNLVAELDIDVVRALYRRGLIYLDVPVYPDDHFQVSALDGFVSNKNQQYEDPTEELLYAVFVASSEHTTVAELAQTLQADLEQLQSAVSLASRLGWAKKVLDPASLLRDTGMPGSPLSESSGGDDGHFSSFSSPFRDSALDDADSAKGPSGSTRFAFMVDANLTSYLMMGSLSPGLKGHAVTLYEAGKLGDSSVAEMCEDLRGVEGRKFEGELQEFADHAFSLRHVLECLRSGGTDLVAMNVSVDSERRDSADADNDRSDIIAADFGEFQMEDTRSLDFDVENIPEGVFLKSTSVAEDEDLKGGPAGFTRFTSGSDLGNMDTMHITSSSIAADGMVTKVKLQPKTNGSRKFRVDVIRMESLAGLAPATVHRVLQRDYDVIVSMIPLPSPPSVSTPDGAGPVHFGPPSRAAATPWMKLLLYKFAGLGPLSVVLVRGQCFRFLPPQLVGCAKALLWSWDGTGISGFGGKFEGTLVEGGILLHCVNFLLKHTSLLIQPYSKASLDEAGKPVMMNVPLPLVTDGLHPHLLFLRQVVDELNLQTMGYIRLVQVPRLEDTSANQSAKKDSWVWVPHSVEFGVPLFDTELCEHVCENVVQSELFHPSSLEKYREDMQVLRKRLLDLITAYRSNGYEAKLAYSGRQLPFPSFDRGTTPMSTSQAFEPPTRLLEEPSQTSTTHAASRLDFGDDDDVGDVPLPGINLFFDGSHLQYLNLEPYLQGRLPGALVVEVAAATQALRDTFPS
ncbi:hypothetical protein BDL97_16G070600 [Sphagnum fallax]|nr:hypothetical protein BDL97_16G070600 [Sphagnum fallax]